MVKGRIEKRGIRRRKMKPVILIITEGSQTEPIYFEQFRTRYTNIDIHIVGSNPNHGKTDYISLVRKAIEYQDKNQLSVAQGDALWVVADGDVNFNNPNPIETKDAYLQKARKMAAKAGIEIAISNPCFEFWYLLHFKYTTSYFRDCGTVTNALKYYIPHYEKTSDVRLQLFPLLENAIRNARCIEAYHISNGAMPPFGIEIGSFSDVYHLVELLRPEDRCIK